MDGQNDEKQRKNCKARNACNGLLSHRCLDRQAVVGSTTTVYYGSTVEPTVAVQPRNANNQIAAWQQDRVSNGGALQIGIAHSEDAGKTWRNVVVPYQVCCGCREKSAQAQRVGDSWLSYSGDGATAYLCVSFLNATQETGCPESREGIAVNTTRDNGASWSNPVYLYPSMRNISDPDAQQFPNLDKPSVTANPAPATRQATGGGGGGNVANAIVVWVTFAPASSGHGDVNCSVTLDAGAGWTSPILLYDPFPDLSARGLSNGVYADCYASANVVLFAPAGRRAVDLMARTYARPGATDAQYASDAFPYQYTLVDIAVVRSINAACTAWERRATVVVPSFVNNPVYTGGYTYDDTGLNITGGVGTLMRNDQSIPAGASSAHTGYLYVVYQSSAFRRDQLNQIGLTFSADGGRTWSAPFRANRTPQSAPNPQAFAPAVAVAAGELVGVFYYDFRLDDRSDVDRRTLTDAWLAVYRLRGHKRRKKLEFVREYRLSPRSFVAQKGPTTTSGQMVAGDYQFLVAEGQRFVACFTQSLRGGFAPPSPSDLPFFSDPATETTLLVDRNRRTATFVSQVPVPDSETCRLCGQRSCTCPPRDLSPPAVQLALTCFTCRDSSLL